MLESGRQSSISMSIPSYDPSPYVRTMPRILPEVQEYCSDTSYESDEEDDVLFVGIHKRQKSTSTTPNSDGEKSTLSLSTDSSVSTRPEHSTLSSYRTVAQYKKIKTTHVAPRTNSTRNHQASIFSNYSRKIVNKLKRAREEDEEEGGHDEKRNRYGHFNTCHWCQLAAFEHADDFPVTIENDVDNVSLPESFQFVQKSVCREGVERADEAFRTGCECMDPQECENSGCTCTDDVDHVPGTRLSGHRMQYLSLHGRRNCLKECFLDQRQAILECNDKCACGPSCGNRVVEKGRTVPLEIFRTSDGRGWGLRCLEDLKKGQFIDLYVGEVITAEEAQRRRQESDVEKRKDVYLFALDKFSDPESYDERLREDPLEVDGEFLCGPTRFMNHSCDPNARIFARVGDSADKHLHDLAFFAIRDIPARLELTFDYVGGKDEWPDQGDKGDLVKCLCGAARCRGWLW